MNAECQLWTFDEAVDLGLGPLHTTRGPLARAAARVLGEVVVPEAGEAAA